MLEGGLGRLELVTEDWGGPEGFWRGASHG